MRRAGVLAVVFVMVALLAVALVGCAPADTAPEQPSETAPATPPGGGDLAGTAWDCLTFAAGGRTQTVLSSAPITAEFGEDGTLGGSSGVNTYSTTFELDGSNITIGQEIATTMMAGPDDAMKQESDYLTALKTAASYQIDEGTGELVLFGPAQNNIARYKPAE